LITSIYSSDIFSKVFKNKSGSYEFEGDGQIQGWKLYKNTLGFDYFYAIESKEKKLSTLSIVITGKKIELVPKAMKEKISDYKTNKEKWAKKKNININHFNEYTFYENKKGIRFHKIGLSYSTSYLPNIKEVSYYVNCKDSSLLLIKYLLLPEHQERESHIIDFLHSMKSCQIHLNSNP